MQREKLMLFSGKYSGNLRRKQWLVNGDRNSRYFQQKANTQRKQKLVYKTNDCGLWMDNQRDIADKFILDYADRLKSNKPSNSNFLDLQLASGISHRDNLNLIKIPDMSQVKQELFFIDSTKTPP